VSPSPRGRVHDVLAPRYRIEREVGRGGVATVYLARDARHDRMVALKVLDPALSAGVSAERFLRETRIAARLMHPHIIPLFDSGDADGWLYYVMPYVAAGSLRARLERERRLPVGDALRIATAVAGALDYAHRAGVVHRDVKPDNVLLHEGEVLVTDFGIARACEDAASEHLTRTGIAVGTPAYMSPEQVTGERDVDGRSDVYSLGCTLYEMLAGEPPFHGSTPRAVMTRRFVGPPASLRMYRREIDVRLDDAVLRALEPDVDDRFPSAAAFAEALSDAAQATAAVTGAPAGAPPVVQTGDGVTAPEHPRAMARRSAPTARVSERVAPASAAPHAGAPHSAAPHSVAVLAFDELGAEHDGGYFGEGMAEEIINALAYVPGVQIASRTSAFAFRGRRLDVREIARQLGVGTVLEGTVRRAGSRLRVTAQLTDASTGYQIWSDRYDRELEDVFAIQDELARIIVAALKVELIGGASHPGLVRRYTDNLRAYDAYLRGRQQLSQITADGLSTAITLFERAVEEDPLQAPAHAALASACIAYAFYGDGAWQPHQLWERARRAATAALHIDPSLADAIGALGTTSVACDWDFVGAEAALAHAVELKPGDPLLHNWHGWALRLVDRSAACLRALERARDLDPLSPFAHRSICRALYFDREYDGVIVECRRVLAWAPRYYLVHVDLASALLGKNDATAALAVLEEARAIRPADTRLLALQGYAAAELGDTDGARRALAELRTLAERQYVTPVDLALVLVALGEHAAAMGELAAAHEALDPWVPWLRWWPLFDSVREHADFTRLLPGVRGVA
jgi:eukaryotic-like serine/threonine-protein kinase